MPVVIAHRGASAAHPENTLDAFHGAAALGADWVELDVRPCASGELVVHHDPHLTDGRPLVEVPVAGLPPAVCTLEEALAVCEHHSLGVNVEVKCLPGEPDEHQRLTVARLVAARLAARASGSAGGLTARLVTSFAPDAIAAVREEVPEVPTGLLSIDADLPAAIDRAAAGGHRALNPWDPLLAPADVQRAHAAGLEVNVWTVDEPDRLAELLGWGVDGLITNVPDVARGIIDGIVP